MVARIRLAPAKDWEVNQPAQLAKVLKVLEGIQAEFNKSASGGKKVSLADLIVLAGNARLWSRRRRARTQGDSGRFTAGPHGCLAGADRRCRLTCSSRSPTAPQHRKAGVRTRSRPDRQGATADADGAEIRVARRSARDQPSIPMGASTVIHGRGGSVLTNRLLRELLGMDTQWKPVSDAREGSKGMTARPASLKWTGTRVDLVFGSSSVLRALAEVYATRMRRKSSFNDFVAAWAKVTDR